MIEHYLSIAAKAIFIENILLAYFLGMCSFLAISKNVEASQGIGKAVIFVNGITVPLNWVIKTYLFDKGALSWTGIERLTNVSEYNDEKYTECKFYKRPRSITRKKIC